MARTSLADRLMRVIGILTIVVAVASCAGGQRAAPPTEPSSPDPAVVQISTGALRGVVADDHRLFAGIPFAAPPVGPLRWQAPEPAAPWKGVRDATRPGPRCLQEAGADLELGRQTDEDCLNLNVWTPRSATDHRRPVMVWIHGGAFLNGSGRMYDARRLVARGDIVVVTINYRLGAPGFLAHPSLGPPGRVGNYGLADQQAALRWVRENIAAFGGDPAKVTIAGESAGGMSVCDHLVAPGSKGLFDAAIIQSGPCQAQAALPVAQARSVEYAAGLGCADPATAARCLRALPPDKLRKPALFYSIGDDELTGPVTGTDVLPGDPVAEIDAGRAAHVPVLIGTNHDEFTLFVGMQYVREGKRYTPADYPRLLAATFGNHAAAVAQRYPLSNFASVPSAISAAVTDGAFSCIGDRLAHSLARDAGGDVFFYEFNDRTAPAPQSLRNVPFPVGASHSLELRYLFDVGDGLTLDPAQARLADQMIDYWSAFVRTGAPDASGQPDWTNLDADKPDQKPVMSLQPDGSHMVGDFEQEHQCQFWAGLQ